MRECEVECESVRECQGVSGECESVSECELEKMCESMSKCECESEFKSKCE